MIIKRIFLSLIATVCLQSASAQQLQASQSHFSTENGMSSNAIAGIYQDDYGFLWIVTMAITFIITVPATAVG